MQEPLAGVAALVLQILTLYSVIKSKDTTECCVEVFRDLEVTRSQLQELELRVSAQFVCTASIAVGASLFTSFLCLLCLARVADRASSGPTSQRAKVASLLLCRKQSTATITWCHSGSARPFPLSVRYQHAHLRHCRVAGRFGSACVPTKGPP